MAAAYVVAAWLVIQVVETIFPAFGFGDAAVRYVTIGFAIGLLPALVLSWVFEWTPQGFKREAEVGERAPASAGAAKRLDRAILVVLALALGYFAFDKFVLEPQRVAEEAIQQQAQIEEAREAGRTDALVESYGDKSIAVLPFVDLSPEGDQQYLADGVAEELLNALSAFKELRVISRSSSFSLRDRDLGARDLAKTLDVAYLLMGSIRNAGDRVRISTRLVDARTDTQLWAETYERNIDDVFAVQDQISAQISSQLRLSLLQFPTAADTANVQAHNLYLQGRALLATHRAEGIDQAIEQFEQAIQADPEFGAAFSSLSVALVFSSRYGSPEAQARIEAAVNRALTLRSDDTDALAAMGRLRIDRGYVTEGRGFLERAVESSPSNALAWRWLGISYSESDPRKYYEYATRAFQLDPLDTTLLNHVASAAVRIGRYEEALARSEQLYRAGWVVPAFQNAEEVHRKRAQVVKQAQTIYRAYREDPNEIGGWVYSAMLMMNLGAMEQAEARALELGERGWEGFIHPLTTVYAMSGDRDKAMAFLQQSENRISDDWLAWIKLRIGREYQASRELYERSLTLPGEQEPVYEDEQWLQFHRYAVTLRETGDDVRSREMFGRIQALLETRAATGMVSGPFQNVNYSLAQVYADTGQIRKALFSLQLAFEQGAISCVPCLKVEPHFDGLRNEVNYRQIVEKLGARFAHQRAELESEGLLLAPDAVMKLQDFHFDPFRMRPLKPDQAPRVNTELHPNAGACLLSF